MSAADLGRMVNTSALVHRRLDDPAHGRTRVVDVVVPVYNEAAALGISITRLHAYLVESVSLHAGASRSSTTRRPTARGAEATRLARDLAARARAAPRPQGPWARAARGVEQSDAAVVAYMDVDLSTDLDALLPLVAPLVSGHSDVSIGSRLAAGRVGGAPAQARVHLARLQRDAAPVFATKVRDAQCGFKAVRADIARALVPAVEDDGWFFDTELLLLAERNGLRIHEVPVDWIDDADSRVDIVQTAAGDMAGSARLVRTFLRGGGRVELGDIARRTGRRRLRPPARELRAIGAVSTIVSLVLFLVWRNPLGAIAANACAVTATFFANTWMHARITARSHRPQWLRAAAVYLGSLVLTSCALVAVHAANGGLPAELVALAATWTVATLARLALLDHRSA